MPGTVIEGDYRALATVRAVSSHRLVLYVRTDDWPDMPNPVARDLREAGYVEVRASHQPGYLLAWFARSTT
jgi:hypothetical protein